MEYKNKIEIFFKFKNGKYIKADKAYRNILLFGIESHKDDLFVILMEHPFALRYIISVFKNKGHDNLKTMEKFYKHIGINFNKMDYVVVNIDGREYKLAIYENNFMANITHIKEIYSMDAENKYDVENIKDKIIVDGGANIGTFALYCAKLGAKKVYAFEPVSIVFNNLMRNIELNGMQNIIIPVKKAIGNKNGSVYINYDEMADMSGSILSNDCTKKEKINTVTLDTFIKGPVDFIKMDIEGFENEALSGGRKILNKYAPILSICAYHKPDDLDVLPKTIMKGNKKYICKVTDRGELHLFCEVLK